MHKFNGMHIYKDIWDQSIVEKNRIMDSVLKQPDKKHLNYWVKIVNIVSLEQDSGLSKFLWKS